MTAAAYARDLDLNLLRVFSVVAETGSVTQAAAHLYLTQPAVSAALKRLQTTIGAPLFARQGRSLVLTTRGQQLSHAARPHLSALVEAALSPTAFDPKTSDGVVRLGLSDMQDRTILPALSRRLGERAPRLRLVVTSVQFRTIAAALSSGAIDLAVTIADELPPSVVRTPLFRGGFVILSDPRHARLGARPTLKRYLAHEHVIVSYNGDLRGVVEDLAGIRRRVRLSVPSFHPVGALVDGTPLLATVPEPIGRALAAQHPALRISPLPRELRLEGATMELLHRASQADEPMLAFVRAQIEAVARSLAASGRSAKPR